MGPGFLIAADHCRAGRALLGWTQAQLAATAGVIRANVVLFEGGQSASPVTRRRIQEALESAGVMFVRPDASGGPGVVLRSLGTEAKPRQPYAFDSSFYEAQARLIASVARHPAYTDLRDAFLSLSRDYYLQARQLAAAAGSSPSPLGR